MRRRSEKALGRRRPVDEAALQAQLTLNEQIWCEDEDRHADYDGRGDGGVAEEGVPRSALAAGPVAEQNLPQDKPTARDGEEYGAVTRGGDLKRRESRCEPQLPLSCFVEVGLERRKRERDPLHGGEVDLAQPKEPCGREREY